MYRLTPTERQQLLAEHNHRCDKCGKEHRVLHAHHSDYAKKPDMVLCPPCHVRMHKQMGPAENHDLFHGVYLELAVSISRELRATMAREKRTKRAIVELALSDYFAKSGKSVKPTAAGTSRKLCPHKGA